MRLHFTLGEFEKVDRIDLFPHNKKAYESALFLMSQTGKAAIIHPTGTGKSFIGFKLALDCPTANICWLSPSEYIFKTQIENLKKVTRGYSPDNITFLTYAKLMMMRENDVSEIYPDYIVLDEFHRCGAEQWGRGIERLLRAFPDVPILGLSATNIRYLDNQRDMADELFNGNVASEMTLGEAIVRGVLLPPTYIISVYSYQKELEKYKQRVKQIKSDGVRNASQKHLDALRYALDKVDGLDVVFQRNMKDECGKYIVFCANVEHMQEIMSYAPKWFANVDKAPHIYSVYSDNPETSSAFEAFKKDASSHLKLLFCIDMLNEGIHVEDISGVILFRPTVSPIIYKQQIGRTLSTSNSRQPIIFDIVNNFDNLYSISSIRNEMDMAISLFKLNGQEKEIINDRFHIIDEARDCRRIFDDLQSSLSASWDMHYVEAKKYYEKHNNLEVPRRYKSNGLSLGTWLLTQRMVYEGRCFGILTDTQIEKLNAIGMVWCNILDLRFEQYFEKAKEYFEQNGNLDVLIGYKTEDGVQLGSWISRLRSQYSGKYSGTALTEERIQRLNGIGMIWDKTNFTWESNYLHAVEYYEQYGNLEIPHNYVCHDGFRLGAWMRYLRTSMNGSVKGRRLPYIQVDQLNRIGMIWDMKFDAQWKNMFELAKKYFLEKGDLDIPAKYKVGKAALGKWIYNQKISKNDGKLSKERIELLEQIGMSWEQALDPWELRYQRAKEYYEANGDLNIPAEYKTVEGFWLNKWLSNQRQAYNGELKNYRLTEEQIKKLEAIGMNWASYSERSWEIRYSEAKSYYEKNSDLMPSAEYLTESGFKLNLWIIHQRDAWKKGILTNQQYELLTAIGMQWNAGPSWEDNYSYAAAYFANNGNLGVLHSFTTEDGMRLGSWLSNQRTLYNAGKLSAEQINMLDKIGMRWGSKHEESWQTGYAAAIKYHSEFGNLIVPIKYKDENQFSLGCWLDSQRKKLKKGKHSQDKIEQLNMLGMNWNGTGS